MDFFLILPAFIAGILTFLAPCTLPLVPGYLGFISGVSLNDLSDPEKAPKIRWKIFLNGLFFVIGFSVVFITMGTLIGFTGAAILAPYRLWLGRIGGVFVIIFGLFMLNILKISFLAGERRFSPQVILKNGRPLNSLILGSAFAFGWTPCVGPILGSILLLASTSTTVFQGAFMLSVFSAGLATPFLLVALGISSASYYIQNLSGYFNFISRVGGVFLIFLGFLLVAGNMGLLVSYSYQVFNFFEYDKLLNYL